MRFHPRKRDLFRHAEAMADGGMPINMEAQRHIASCTKCRETVNAIRESLAFCTDARPLEPSEALTSQILAAAREERANVHAPRRLRHVVGTWAQGMTGFITVCILAGITFQLAATEPRENQQASALAQPRVDAPPSMMAEGITPEAIRRASSDFHELAAVLETPAADRQSIDEWRHRRTAMALNSDLSEALAALQRNPGCIRASQLATASLQRQVDTLKSLYVERTL